MQRRQKLIPLRVAAPLTMGAAILGSILGFGVVSAFKPRPAAVSEAASLSSAPAAIPSAEAAPSAEPSDGAPDAGQTDASRPADAGDAGAGGTDVDLSDAGLKPYEAYLYVASSASADVWVQGIKIGRTNEKLKLACTKGLRFTRLGQEPGPAWISDATSIPIPCGSVTQLRLDPSEQKLNTLPSQPAQPKPPGVKPLPTAKINKDNPY